jgi:UV DNA damage endonuclease
VTADKPRIAVEAAIAGLRGLRLGLCCGFVDVPIRFRTTTARYAGSRAASARRALLRQISLDNAEALARAIDWCAQHRVGAFRITSELLPLYTHPRLGYELAQLDDEGAIAERLRLAGERARHQGIRLSFHPDQFVVPGSHRPEVVRQSLRELEYHAMLAALIGAEQLTIHGGGAYGGKEAALDRLARGLDRLSHDARSLIALENDDRVYTVEDLLPLCRSAELPLVYDVHHHRCNPDRLTIDEATDAAAATWRGREPWAHISSPLGGWRAPNPRSHADFIQPPDVPQAWFRRRVTVDVEAKAKERAVLRLERWLRSAPATRRVPPMMIR